MSNRDPAKLDRLAQWYTHHLQSFLISLNDLFKKPLASLMTIMVIGITVSLPASLYVLLQNLQGISQQWDKSGSIALYLKKGIPDFQISATLSDLEKDPAIKKVKYISPQEGLQDFRRITKFNHILTELKQNPLPGVIVITPAENQQSPSDLKRLVKQLRDLPLVKIAQVDLAWVQRLYYIITIGKRMTYALALLLGLGVLFIIGNTIRLTIEHHYEEMVVLKLMGAANAFIRRPILYRGLFYGLFGGLFAWLLVGMILSWLASPAQALANSYNQNLLLQGLPWVSGGLILIFSSMLGVIGAWLAAHRQLKTMA